MITIDSIQSAIQAIDDFRIEHSAGLTDDVKAKIRDLASAPSPVDQCVNMAEFLYARRAELPAAANDLGAALASYCAQNGWHGLLTDNRGQAMMAVMLNDAGALPDGMIIPESAPEPRAEYSAVAKQDVPAGLPLPLPDQAAEAPTGGEVAPGQPGL